MKIDEKSKIVPVEVNKTRDVSLYELFKILQIEYIHNELRYKIYPSKSDKIFHEKVMKYKKTKIEDIALRNMPFMDCLIPFVLKI